MDIKELYVVHNVQTNQKPCARKSIARFYKELLNNRIEKFEGICPEELRMRAIILPPEMMLNSLKRKIEKRLATTR